MLICVGYGWPRVYITWTHNEQTISNSSLFSVSEEDTIQGERLLRRSFLQISSVEAENAGAYTCTVSNGESSVTSSTQLTVAGGF